MVHYIICVYLVTSSNAQNNQNCVGINEKAVKNIDKKNQPGMWGEHSGLYYLGLVREDIGEVSRSEEVSHRLCVKDESLSDVGKGVGSLRCCGSLGGGHGDIDRVHFGFSGFAPAASADETVYVNIPVGIAFARAKDVVM